MSSPLARVRSLSIEIQHWHQSTAPLFDRDEGPIDYEDFDDEDDLWASVEPLHLVRPHRLFLHTHDAPLAIGELSFDVPCSSIRRQKFLSEQIFAFVSPRTVLPVSRDSGIWNGDMYSFRSLDFLRDAWDVVERVIFSGQTIGLQNLALDDYYELPLFLVWAGLQEGQGRSLELVLDFTKQPLTARHGGYQRLESIMDDAGATKEMTSLLDLKVIVKVLQADASEVTSNVEALPDWQKKLVVVERV